MQERKARFLKFIIAYKTIMGSLELIIFFGLLKLVDKDLKIAATTFAKYLNLDIENQYIRLLIENIAQVEHNTMIGLSISVFLFSAFNLVEAWGLHLRRKWAEWLTVASTGAMIPFEIYTIYDKVTVVRIIVLALNCAIVYYLATRKDLFHSKREMEELKKREQEELGKHKTRLEEIVQKEHELEEIITNELELERLLEKKIAIEEHFLTERDADAKARLNNELRLLTERENELIELIRDEKRTLH
ncbi:MAG: DUF2127 domain-containing protein [Deltaproteobacteria bacterium]|nr:DUF2127 domain-containing protein [Deltaproteobacteria bacterium]